MNHSVNLEFRLCIAYVAYMTVKLSTHKFTQDHYDTKHHLGPDQGKIKTI